MKKTLLLMLALVQVSAAVYAQNKPVYKMAPKSIIERQDAGQLVLPGKKTLKVADAPTRINLESDERILGYYTSDEYSSQNCAYGVGADYYIAGCEFTDEQIGRMVGGQITKVRFAINGSIGASNVYIYSVDRSGVIVDSFDPVSVASTSDGWNEVELPTPVTIKDDMDYLIGYEVKNCARLYPMLTDAEVNPGGAKDGGLLLYGDLGQGEGWYSLGTGYGNLCIQAVVKGGTFIENDVTISDLTTNTFLKSGDEFTSTFRICNSGSNDVTSYTLKMFVDDAELGTLDTPIPVSSVKESVLLTAELPKNLSIGKHTLKLVVDKVNGVDPSSEFGDNVTETEFTAYENAMTRTYNLVEQFTSQYCTYCPLGYNVLNALAEKRSDIAWVSLHGSGMGNDDYCFAEVDYIDYFVGGGSYPSGAFNRYYVNDNSVNAYSTLALSLGYPAEYADQAAEMFSQVIDMSNEAIPAFASIDLTTSYDASTRKLDVKVTSEAAEGFDKLVGDAAITVYLLEDGLVSKQLNSGVWDYNYTHNHVLRDILTSYFGDAVTWSDGKAEMDFSTVLDSDWNAENMQVGAFIGRPIVMNSMTPVTSLDDAYVLNTNKVALGETTGIESVGMDEADVKEVARYTIDGVRISAPQKGVNIVKMSNGKVYKVLVK